MQIHPSLTEQESESRVQNFAYFFDQPNERMLQPYPPRRKAGDSRKEDTLAPFQKTSREQHIQHSDRKQRMRDRVHAVKPFKGKDLKELKGILPLSPNSPEEVIYTPAGVLRMGLLVDLFKSTSKPLKVQSKKSSIDIENTPSIISSDNITSTGSLNETLREEPPDKVEGRPLQDEESIFNENLLITSSASVIADVLVGSEPLSQLQSNPPINSNDFETDESLTNSKDGLVGKGQTQVSVQLNFIESSGSTPGTSPEELSLSGLKLGRRLSIDRTTLGSRRKRLSVEDFANATSEKDPDAIKWVYSEQLRLYMPYGDLSLKQAESLKAWKERESTR